MEAWKLGQARKDNGILFLVSKDDRKMRIEVGRGLEGRLTDLMAGRIIDLVVKPRFKRGDFDGGFTAGVASLIDATRGEFKAEGKDSRKGTQPFHSSWLFLFVILILFFFFLSSARKRGKTSNGRGHGGSPGGFVIFPSGRGGGGEHLRRGWGNLWRGRSLRELVMKHRLTASDFFSEEEKEK